MVLWRDALLRTACWNTLVFTAFTVPATMLVALGLAMLLNLKVRGQAFYRAAFFLLSIVPVVAASMLWICVFNPQYGLLNVCLRTVKPWLDPYVADPVPGWLTDPAWAKPALILVSVWVAGSNMVLYLAGLQEVPRELYEAAEIDGANAWRRAWHITLPSISPTLFYTLIMGVIGALQSFIQSRVMTNGGPADSTLFYALYLFNMMAMSLLLTLPVILLFFFAQKTFIQGIKTTSSKG